jgi:long-chain fatty acid transport protein
MSKKCFSLLLGLVLLVATSSTVFASGFAIVEQSVSGLGVSFSGAVSGDDASSMFFNPASISLIDGQQAVAGVHVIFPSTKFKAEKAYNTLQEQSIFGPGGYDGSLGTNDGGDGGVTAVVPNLYYSNKLNKKWSMGLGINAPFGLATD